MILRCNDTFREMFGINVSNEDMIGLDCEALGGVTSKSFMNPTEFLANVALILKNRKLILNDEVHLKNGMILERDYIPITIGEEYKGHCWHYRDITTKKKLSEYLAQTAKDSTYILSNIAHEINNPLNGIIGLSDLLLLESESNHEDIKLIKQAGNDIKRMVDIFLDNKKDVCDEKFNTKDLILKSYHTFRTEASEKNLYLTYKNDLPQECNSKYIYITQILNNLIGNAIKYTKTGGVHISTSLKECSVISIDIIDSGVGIMESNFIKIFEPFSQLDRNSNGIGLGLHLSKNLQYKRRESIG